VRYVKIKENLVTADIAPQDLLAGETPRLLDEWQIAPQLWDAIRFEVDHRDGVYVVPIGCLKD